MFLPRNNKDWDFAGKRSRNGVPDQSLGIGFLLRISNLEIGEDQKTIR